MDFSFDIDESGRYLVGLSQDDQHATVTASNVPEAGDDLLAALEDARDTGLGESFWAEQGGEYRWLFRRDGSRLTVAVMWCSGTITGWLHVFRAECEFEAFVARAHAELQRARMTV
jgi:hypothetical protein